jgi:hypothetical protein
VVLRGPKWGADHELVHEHRDRAPRGLERFLLSKTLAANSTRLCGECFFGQIFALALHVILFTPQLDNHTCNGLSILYLF